MFLQSPLRFVPCVFAILWAAFAHGADKKILLIAGPPSHGPGAHEHNAGMLLMQKCLKGVDGLRTDITLGGWPQDPNAFNGVDAVIIYADGGPKHVALQDDRL